jgi:ABC transporter substrate binding protein
LNTIATRRTSGAISLSSRTQLPACVGPEILIPVTFPPGRRKLATKPEGGGLLSYGVDQTENFRRAATYVDRILQGTSPSELPVQSPVKFQPVINLRTAKALGLTIPEAVMQRADEIID